MSPDFAYKALEELGNCQSAPNLFQGCLEAFASPYWEIRQRASRLLIRIGPQQGLIDALRGAYPTGSTHQRYWIMKLLAHLLGAETLPWIKKVYAGTQDPSLRAHAISATSEIKGAEAAEFLVNTLKDDSWLNRYAAASSIAERGPEVLSYLQKGFTEGSGDLKYWCLRLIVQVMGPESATTIRKGMRSEDANLRHYVLRSMEHVEGDWCIPLLVDFLKDPNWSNRRVASDLLRSRGRQALKPLARAAESSQADLRYWAVRTLGETGDERAVKPLEQFLYTCDAPEEGLWALAALSRIPCAASARAILEAAYEFPKERPQVIGYLKNLGVATLRPAIEYLDSPNTIIQGLSQEVLESLDFPGIPAFTALLEEMDQEARDDLLATLGQISREELERLLASPEVNLELLQAQARTGSLHAFPTMSTISVRLPSPEGDPVPLSAPSGQVRQPTAKQYPVPLLEVLRQAISLNASDIHLKASLPPIFRIYGSLRRTDLPPLSAEHTRNLLREVLPKKLFENFDREETEVDCAFEGGQGLGRFRINGYHDLQGPGLAMRHIPGKPVSLTALGLPRVFRDLCALDRGLILVTGPTGSGKTTTLAAMIDHINATREAHILTVEDPIEFLHENRMSIITSRELGSHTQSFSLALRAALREDPDVILIGEMRDLETMRLAITAAETGHLVLSTLHTNSPGETVDRIINVFPPDHHHLIRTSLASSLAAIISQTLIPTTDGKRAPVRDVLIKTPAVAHLIRDAKLYQVDQAIVAGRREGMQTRDEDLLRLLKEGRIQRDTALAHCTDRKTFLGSGVGGM
jgi:twitching motility protein PilT